MMTQPDWKYLKDGVYRPDLVRYLTYLDWGRVGKLVGPILVI
jgi:hypothetical protein